MNLSNFLKNAVYAIVFGFMGLIIGIWTSDVLYMVIFKNIDRVTTIYISVGLIVFIIISASFLGFAKGKSLLE
ncbi:MAG: hypothetical protein OIN86_07555 [Candidatus Methanoperedens sp.]|nr:hypothetical protein [Candidatus Methanoperedens sp.]CAG0977347.1 hypothetical protein METP1_01575 [Methanosarcinales archaeon]